MIKYFSLPDYWNHFFEIQALFQYRNLHPEYFYSDRIFNSSYGLPPDLIWNGGRVMPQVDRTLSRDMVFDYYKSLPDFHLRHTCTNIVLDEQLVQDKDCNEFIEKYYNSNDYVIFSTQVLHDHLLSIVPEDHFIYSTTMGIRDIDKLNQYSENNMVVLDYLYNNNNQYLQQIKHPQNIEVLCGELCIDDCPYRFEHYISVSKTNAHIPLRLNESDSCRFTDKIQGNPPMVEWYFQMFKHAVSNDRIDELANMGIQNFKIAGRTRPTEAFFAFIIYYLILPEHQEDAKRDLLIETRKKKLKYTMSKR